MNKTSHKIIRTVSNLIIILLITIAPATSLFTIGVSAQYGEGIYGDGIYSESSDTDGGPTITPPVDGTTPDPQPDQTSTEAESSAPLASTGEPQRIAAVALLFGAILAALVLIIRRPKHKTKDD
jgi:hypothetical protein